MWEREKSTWPNHELSRFVETAGSRWHVQQMGSGPPLLLVHGTGASTHSWRDVLPLLGRHYTVLAPDLPGHGFTEASGTARSSIVGMSESLAALLGALRFKPLYCVGHSAGAVILCRMALDRHIDPRVIVSLNGAFVPLGGSAGVLFSPLARLLAGSSLLARLLASRAGNAASVARVLDSTGSKVDAQGLDLYTRLVRNPKHLAGALGMMGNWDLRSFARDLPRLTTPLVLLAAENDRTVPPHQAFATKQRLANASVCALPGLGHLAHEEEPALVAEKISSICRAHPGAP